MMETGKGHFLWKWQCLASMLDSWGVVAVISETLGIYFKGNLHTARTGPSTFASMKTGRKQKWPGPCPGGISLGQGLNLGPWTVDRPFEHTWSHIQAIYIGINRHILRRWDVLDVQSSPFRETFQRMVNLGSIIILSFGDWIITRCDDLWYSSQTIDIWYFYWHLPLIYNGPYIEFDDVCYFIFVEWIFGISIFLVSEDPAF